MNYINDEKELKYIIFVPLIQNLNSGVVLMDLEKIRNMNRDLFSPEKIRLYKNEYNLPTWGDQVNYF